MWIKEKLVITTSIKSLPKAQNQRFQFIILVQVRVKKKFSSRSVQIYLIRGPVGFGQSAIRSGTSYTNQGQEIRSYLIWTAQECPDNHVSNPVIVRGPFVVCVKTDLHEGGLEENIRMLNLDETFQNYIHFG